MKTSKRAKEIEEQLAYVRWRKIKNERSIAESLQLQKTMVENDEVFKLSSKNATERSLWVQSVIKSELDAPLVLSDAEIYKLYQDTLRAKQTEEERARRLEISADRILHHLEARANRLAPRNLRGSMEVAGAQDVNANSLSASASKSPGKSTGQSPTETGATLSPLQPSIERVKEFREACRNATKERSAYHLDPLKRSDMIRMENRKQFSKGLKL